MLDLEDMDDDKQKELRTKYYGEAYCNVMLHFCDCLFSSTVQEGIANAVGVDYNTITQLDNVDNQ